MRRSTLIRLLPVVILLAGLALTAGMVSSARADAADSERATATGNRAYVAAVASAAESRLDGISDRLTAAGKNVAAATVDDVGAQIDATGLLESSSLVEAICVPVAGELSCETFNGTIDQGPMPIEEPGFQVIDRGQLKDKLAYAAVNPSTRAVASVLIIDRDMLFVRVQRNLPLEVALFGLPGGDEAEPLPITSSDVGGGLSIDEVTGDLTSTRNKVLLGEDVVLRTMATPSQLVTDDRGSTTLLLVVGLGLTVSLAALAMGGSRSLFRVIEERDEADAARDQAAQRFRTSFANAPIGVVEVDSSGRIVAVNPRFASQLGYNVDELDGTELLDLIDGEDRPAARGRLQHLLNGERVADQSERRYRERNGGAVWVRESASVLELGEHRRHVLIQAEDISDERRSRAELHRKALFDDLTGLPNRANLTARLNRALEAEQANGDVLAVMFVDLDKFKEVNDTHGHEAGDLLLIEVAERLRRVSRSSDTVARLGGDEFVVICEGLENEEDAERCAQRFYEALSVPMVIGNVDVPVQASIGLAITSGVTSPEQVLREADQAMYQAKTTGRNRLVKFETVAEDRLPSEPKNTECSEDELLEAIEADRFVVHYQPVFDANDRDRIVGVEALVRLEHPRRGLVMPSDFLRPAEKSGLISQIDMIVVSKGLAAMAEWTEVDDIVRDWFISFNLATINFHHRPFADELLAAIAKSSLDPHQVILERAESGFMHQPPVAVVATRALRSAGVRIAIDHFGTGAVSLSEVPSLEFDLLKIDRSFVRSPSIRQQSLLNAMAKMGSALDLAVMVEGIETDEELRAVRGAKIPLAQGYHLCRPMDDQAIAMQYLSRSPLDRFAVPPSAI
ncbi:MAG: EAL domain-containing protein [Acidimicrobiales bacterium]